MDRDRILALLLIAVGLLLVGASVPVLRLDTARADCRRACEPFVSRYSGGTCLCATTDPERWWSPPVGGEE